MKNVQVLIGRYLNVYTGGTRYTALDGGAQAVGSTESQLAQICAADGVLRNLRVELSAAPGSGKSYTFTIYKNGSSTALTVTISDSATTGEYTGQISVTAGDYISLQTVSTNTPTSASATWSSEFVATSGKTILMGSSGTDTTAQNGYLGFKGCQSDTTTEYNCHLLIPCPGTISDLYVRISGSVSPNTAIYTVRKNGVDTGLTVTFSGSTVEISDTTHSFTVAAGDYLTLQRTGTSTASHRVNFGVAFTPDTLGNFILSRPSLGTACNGAGTNKAYEGINCPGLIFNSGEGTYEQISYGFTLKNIYIEINSSDASSCTFTVRKNEADSALAVTIAAGNTAANAAADVTVAAGDMLAIEKTSAVSYGKYANIAYTGNKVESLTETITSDAKIKVEDKQQTVLSDAKIVLGTLSEEIDSDAEIRSRVQQNITSDASVQTTPHSDILSDAKVVTQEQNSITSDSLIQHRVDYELLSDAKVVTRVQQTTNSNSLIKAVKYFYGQIKARVSNSKKFFGQLIVSQPTPINPTGLVISDLYTGDAVELVWTDTGNYGYNVYKDVGGVWTLLNTSVLVGATSYIAGALTTNVTYTFKVVAVNGAGTESSGVTGSKMPTFSTSHYTDADYQIYIDGSILNDVILDSVELSFAPQYSTARFHLNILPSTIGLPDAARQVVTVFIRNRLVFTGYLVRRENVWSGSALQVNYSSIDKSYQYTFTTPICNNFAGLGFGWGSDGLLNSLLRGLGLPTGLPIKNSIQNSSFYDSTMRDIMTSFASECGSWVVHTDQAGISEFYQYGAPLYNRTYTLGVNILEYRNSTDITDQVNKVVVRSPVGRSLEEEFVTDNIEGLLISSAEMDDVATPNRSGSPITSDYESSIAQPWLAGVNGWTRAGITGRAQYIQTSYDSKPFVAFMIEATDIADLRIEALINDRPEIEEYDTTVDGQHKEVTPDAVGLTTWATGTNEARPCANRIKLFSASWRPVNAQTVVQGSRTYIRIDDIPVLFKERVVETSRGYHTVSNVDGSIVTEFDNVMYMEEPWQTIAPIRVYYTHAGTYSTGSYGSGDIQRSQLLNTYDDLNDRAHEIYSRLQHDSVQGSMTILGDETLTLRTKVNGLEVIRVTHDFSSGYRTHVDLTTPQNLYVYEVEKNYRDRVVSRDISITTEDVYSRVASNANSSSGGATQDKKRDIRTSGASWGD